MIGVLNLTVKAVTKLNAHKKTTKSLQNPRSGMEIFKMVKSGVDPFF